MHKVPASITSYYQARAKYVAELLRTTQSWHKVRPSTTSYYKACTKDVPVLLRTTKLAQSTSQYYFVLQSLHKVRPSTTSYYKACKKYVPVLLRTTKLAQSTCQYDFLLSSRKVRRRTTSYYTKLAQSTSQYYFVLQSLHKVRPSTTSYYKACTKYVKNRNLLQFLTIELHVVRKGCAGPLKVAIAPHFLTFDVRFVRKDSKFRKNSLMNSLVFDARSIPCERVAIDYTQNRNFTSFFDARSISCERVAIDYSKSQFYIILDARRPFRAKGLRSTTQNRNFTSFF